MELTFETLSGVTRGLESSRPSDLVFHPPCKGRSRFKKKSLLKHTRQDCGWMLVSGAMKACSIFEKKFLIYVTRTSICETVKKRGTKIDLNVNFASSF